jgi:nucleoside-diphosphate-sugar epimerase
MIELAQRIFSLYHELTGRPVEAPLAFEHLPSFADDVQVRVPSIDKARRLLGWEPTVRLDDMLRRTVAHALTEETTVAG